MHISGIEVEDEERVTTNLDEVGVMSSKLTFFIFLGIPDEYKEEEAEVSDSAF